MPEIEAETTEPKMTEADFGALRKLPDGWFGWIDVILIRCAEFRLKRLVDRGMVKRKLVGEWPDCEWRYHVTKKGRAINGRGN